MQRKIVAKIYLLLCWHLSGSNAILFDQPYYISNSKKIANQTLDQNLRIFKPSCTYQDDFIFSVSKCFKSETATFGAKTRQNPPQKFLPKNHLNFRPNRHNFRNFEVEKLNFLQIPLMFTEKCENIAFFYPPQRIFSATRKSKTPKTPPPRHFYQHWA